MAIANCKNLMGKALEDSSRAFSFLRFTAFVPLFPQDSYVCLPKDRQKVELDFCVGGTSPVENTYGISRLN